MQVLEPDLGVLLLVSSRLLEEGGNLDEAVLLGLGSVVSVFVAGLGLAGEGLLEVLLGFGAGQAASGGLGGSRGCGAFDGAVLSAAEDLYEFLAGLLAARAGGGGVIPFVDITTDGTFESCHNELDLTG